jgi:hypothetical protein
LDRRAAAKLGGLARATKYTPQEQGRMLEPAHRGLREKFRRQAQAEAEAEGKTLPEKEIQRRGELLYRAHFVRLAAASADARRRQKAGVPKRQAGVDGGQA